MGERTVYRIVYTETAAADIEDKVLYIRKKLRSPRTAANWYAAVREEIRKNLSFLPEEFPPYEESPWREKGVRLFVTRNDVVLYSVDLAKREVIILGVCTKGRDLAAHLEES